MIFDASFLKKGIDAINKLEKIQKNFLSIKINASGIKGAEKVINEYANQIEADLRKRPEFIKDDGSFDSEKAKPVFLKTINEFMKARLKVKKPSALAPLKTFIDRNMK